MEMGVKIFEKLQTEGPLQLAAKEEIEEIRQLKQQTISKTTFFAKYSGIYGRVYGGRHSNDCSLIHPIVYGLQIKRK